MYFIEILTLSLILNSTQLYALDDFFSWYRELEQEDGLSNYYIHKLTYITKR
jgi:hypothetical protein